MKGTGRISERARGELRKLLGANLADSPEALTLHGYDAANILIRPELVAFPRDARQIVAIMHLANTEHFPVVPRGAGAGFSGGALAVQGGLVLNLGRLNRILSIDEANLTADVEPGVITGVLHSAVEERGLFYPPDPASSDYCSIGGNIAENAGGPRAFKYGVTEHYVLGLEVITPTGELINVGGRTIKNVAGYNLLKLFIGSEGTLGIVTRAVLRLIPKPKTERTARLFFPDVGAAAQTVSAIIAAKVVPATIELMDEGSLRAVRDFLGVDIDPVCGALLLVRVDGHPAACDDEAREIASIARAHGCIGVEIARDETEEREIWRIRKSLSPAVGKMANTKLNEDVVVPRSRIPELIAAAAEIGRQRGILVVNFGHAGDGNIHVNFMYDRFDPRQREEVLAGIGELMRTVVAMDGSITGEHGVGIMKSDYLGLQYDPATLAVMRKLKRTLDPNNILNPGKIFPESAER